MSIQLITTADGSHSIYVPELNEHYHSVHGAIQESKHVFINAGLKAPGLLTVTPLRILEIGMGTGLNVFLTFLENIEHKKQIVYTAIEAFPVNEKLIHELNYVKELNAKEHQDIFNKIHRSSWEQQITLSPHFTFRKIKNTIQETTLTEKQFDLIYFDAFSPEIQPEMWRENVFEKLFQSLNSNGILVTYCAKGVVKRILKKVGFTIENLPGPPGKREMTRGVKSQ